MSALIANPDDLRFTQDSIAIKFKYPYDHLRIDDAVEQIQQGLLTASEITPMNVVRYNGILWSLDNRRLWVFRRARVQKVTVNIVSSSYSQRSLTFFMSLDDQLERTYSSPLYYPRVRGTVRSSIFTRVRVSSTVLPSSSQRAAVLPPSSLLGRQSSSTSSSRNTHLPAPVHSSSSVGLSESRGVSRPAASYTGSHSPPAPSYTGSHSRPAPSYTGSHSPPAPSYTGSHSRPAPSYTGSHSPPAPSYTGSQSRPAPSRSRDSNSATNDDFPLSITGICTVIIGLVIIGFFKRF